MTRVSALGALGCLALACCHPEPGRLCDRVRFVWPYLDLDTGDDVSDRAGLQVELAISTGLDEGTPITLFLSQNDEDEPASLMQRSTDADGIVHFAEVTIPTGEVILYAEAETECGDFRSGRRTYVWEGVGRPRCDLQVSPGPVQVEGQALPVLLPEHDVDPAQEGFQTQVLVEAGRGDMTVDLFHVDRELDERNQLSLLPDGDGSAEAVVTLGPGEQALRALCEWEPLALRPSSPTLVFWVEAP